VGDVPAHRATVLVDRDFELQSLSGTAADAASGRPRLVVVTGEAGAGKTRLWTEFVDTLPDGWSTVQSAHGASDSFAPPFDDLVGGFEPSLDDPAVALGRALADRLRNDAARQPVAFCVEDLHALDPVAAGALAETLDALDGACVLLVATSRVGSGAIGDARARAIAAALEHPGATELRLGPLSRLGVAAVLQDLTGRQDPARVDELLRRSGGNPLFLEELAMTRRDAVPATVQEAVHARLAGVDRSAADLAEVVAVAATPVPESLLDELTDGASRALAQLLDNGIAIRVGHGQIALRHAVVGEALVAAMAPPHRARLHRQLAQSLEHSPEVKPEDLARHWSAAGETERAAPHALAAADRCHLVGAHATASEFFEIGLRYPPGGHVDLLRYLERAAVSATLAGDDARAATCLAQLRDLRDEDDRVRLAHPWLNLAVLQLADRDQRWAYRTTAGSPTDLLATAMGAIERGEFDRARRFAARAADAASTGSDLTSWATAGLTLFYAGDVRGAHTALGRLSDTALETGDISIAARACGHRARVGWGAGEVELATSLAREALSIALREPHSGVWPHMQIGLISALSARGDLLEAKSLASEIVRLEDPLLATMVEFPLALIDIEEGELGSARSRLEPLATVVRAAANDYLTAPVILALARLELLSDHPREALDLLGEADGLIRSPFHDYACELQYLSARAAVACGDAARRARVDADAAMLARHLSGPDVQATATAVAAWGARVAGRHEEATSRFETAAAIWERAPRWGRAAEAWLDAAQAARTAGLDHRTAIDRATALAEEHGLGWQSRRARALSAVASAAAATPSDSVARRLTPRERELLCLVAAGRTNREIAAALFLSQHTVRNYLAALFAKLGVARRAEAAALAARSQLAPEPRE
jgi:DNA-binding CsgD family transcriptional regulator